MTDSKNLLPTDEELMEAYKMGNTQAFNSLFARYSAKTYGYILSKTGSKETADDLLQQVFLKLHNKRSLYDKKYVFLSWFFTITKNTLIDHFRKSGKEASKIKSFIAEQGDVTAPPPTRPTFDTPLLEHYKALGLTSHQTHVLKLKFESDLSSTEIAHLIGSSAANVRQIISRSIKKIKNNIKHLKEFSP